VLRSRRRLIDELQSTARALELSQDENARAAVAAERVSIARELHDVVAHAVSVMIVQAGAAELVLDAEPERAREPILAVQESGRQALSELRRLLGMLRPDRLRTSALVPQPGLAELGPLADKLREAGLSVDLHQSGVPDGLPPGIDLAAFRIVQEALTNVLKHADATVAHVALSYGADVIELEVTDDGRGSRSGTDGGGHGLLGMRERATAYGGEFHAGPAEAGGYGVIARLPIPREP
jgi:signal transduction histidine kinase